MSIWTHVAGIIRVDHIPSLANDKELALGENDVSQYHYTINFNPNMWLPYDVEKID